jgi:IstB-like ATP binding protein
VTARSAPPLAPDLVAGLKRLKLARIRAMAPETLQTAKTQRWAPEELLRALVEAEIAAREATNQRLRHKAAGFPVTKTLDEFKVQASSVPQATFDYLASLEWVRAAENLCLVGPAGTGKSHCSSPWATPPSLPATRSATSPPPSWSRPSTKAWPTTPSAACSTGCYATT